MTRGLAAALLVTLVACQGGSGGEPPATDRGSGNGSGVVRDAGDGRGTQVDLDDASPIVPDDARPKPEEPEPPDPSKVIAELGAIPAWQAVTDRAQLLARRGQHGIVYGRIGAPILMAGPVPAPPMQPPMDAGLIPSPYVWLVDDTDGNGALGIRVALGKSAASEGDRVALGGAWHVDEERRWYWKVDSLTPLPPPPPSDLKDPPAPVPSHAIVDGSLPSGARTISVAKDHDIVYFQIVGPPPVRDGDGWLVANELGDVPVARMTLPGERASYGGQDLRAADERWQLKRGQTYWVRIGKIRRHGADQPVSVNARTTPVRVK
ncbi:MAG: hypothetical protein M3680_03340 [Myxococcota bacterium]|nr:hypothetical protein [Myxococcota bacterium]